MSQIFLFILSNFWNKNVAHGILGGVFRVVRFNLGEWDRELICPIILGRLTEWGGTWAEGKID
jgi:hypothetical protein